MQPYERFFPHNDDFRSPYERDRDRVIHTGAFRMLEYKTQVFLNTEGDYFRTRLTHSLEASQIARTIAKHLGLNDVLAETIALAHDIGHTPFGHIGGDTLHEALINTDNPNGFDHNFQSFRVLTRLEKRYPQFNGLNLTLATLEGILKHSYPYKKPFLDSFIVENFALDFHPSLEAMIVDHADEIAYTSADIDDAVRYGLLDFSTLLENSLAKNAYDKTLAEGITPHETIFRIRYSSHLISLMIYDLIETSAQSLKEVPTDIVHHGLLQAETLAPVGFSPTMRKTVKELKKILFQRVYRHETILVRMHFAKTVIEGLFKAYKNSPEMLPAEHRIRLDTRHLGRVIADFIAGLSDRGAIELYRKLY